MINILGNENSGPFRGHRFLSGVNKIEAYLVFPLEGFPPYHLGTDIELIMHSSPIAYAQVLRCSLPIRLQPSLRSQFHAELEE
jgi:hypothetical protein